MNSCQKRRRTSPHLLPLLRATRRESVGSTAGAALCGRPQCRPADRLGHRAFRFVLNSCPKSINIAGGWASSHEHLARPGILRLLPRQGLFACAHSPVQLGTAGNTPLLATLRGAAVSLTAGLACSSSWRGVGNGSRYGVGPFLGGGRSAGTPAGAAPE